MLPEVDRSATAERPFALRLFFGLLLLLALAGPGSNRWLGYSQEENDAASRTVDLVLAGGPFDRAHLGDLPGRHGLVSLAARLPWAILALPVRADGPFERADDVTLSARQPLAEAVFSLAPQVEVAALATLLALWVARVTGSRRRALLTATGALFASQLWVYAYAGMESLPSLLLLLAAFVTVGPTRLAGRWRDVVAAFALAAAVAVKIVTPILLPVGAWLAWRSACRSVEEGARRAGPALALSAGATALLYAVSRRAADAYLARNPIFGGRSPLEELRVALVDTPFDWLAHLHGFFLSFDKGLLIFSPLAFVGLCRAAAALARREGGGRRRLAGPAMDAAILALGSAACFAGPLSFLGMWTDETWGPRYLTPVVAPAFLALALLPPYRGGTRVSRALVVAAAVTGILISLLGVAVSYGQLSSLASAIGPTELRTYQTDFEWNHPRVHALLFASWVRQVRHPERYETYFHYPRWWPAMPRGNPGVVRVPLARFARPQPIVLRLLIDGDSPALRPLAWGLLLAGAAGAWLLIGLARASPRGGPASPTRREAPAS